LEVVRDAEVGELEHLLDAGAGVAQNFDECPAPEGVFFLEGEVVDVAVPDEPDVAELRSIRLDSAPLSSVVIEGFADRDGLYCGQERLRRGQAGFDGRDEPRQYRGQQPGLLVDTGDLACVAFCVARRVGGGERTEK